MVCSIGTPIYVRFIVMVNVSGVPVQPLANGVTVMVAVVVVAPLLVAVKEPMFPLPEAASPMDGVSLIQPNEVPVTVSVNEMAVVGSPLHKVSSLIGATVGVGFTVMVNVSGAPVHPLAEGATVIDAVTIVDPVFVAVNVAMFPLPTAAKPIEGVSFVQSNVVPSTVSTNVTAVVEAPLHNIWGFTDATVGVGFTMMLNVSGEPVQVLAEGVTVTVAVITVAPALMAVNAAMFPVPVPANPMEGVALVQSKVVLATVSTKVTATVEAPLQSVCGFTASTVGVGLTVMVNVSGVPVQVFAEGITVIVAVSIEEPLFIALKVAMSPFPPTASPIEASLFVHAYVVPTTGAAKTTGVVAAPLHSVWPVTGDTVGVGFIVIVNVSGLPTQPLADGVTVTVAVTIEEPLFMALKEGMSPLPAVPRPIEGMSFVQLKDVPATVPTNITPVVCAPLHNVWSVTVATVGVGFTVMVNVSGVPVQPLADGVAVMLAVCIVAPVLVAVNAGMSPFPFAASPMEGLSFVQTKDVALTPPAKFTAVATEPLHRVWSAMGSTLGVGLIVTVKLMGNPKHEFAEGVAEIFAVMGELVALVAV